MKITLPSAVSLSNEIESCLIDFPRWNNSITEIDHFQLPHWEVFIHWLGYKWWRMVWASRKGLVRQKKTKWESPNRAKEMRRSLWQETRQFSVVQHWNWEDSAKSFLARYPIKNCRNVLCVQQTLKKWKIRQTLKNNQIPKILEKIDESRRQKKKKYVCPLPRSVF